MEEDLSKPQEKRKNHKNDEYVHYQKINIFGEDSVGKSTLISYFENYDNTEYSAKDDFQRVYSNESFKINNSLVDDIKRVKIDFNEDRNLNFYIYETSLSRYENIKMNLDVLLVQTECIIVMWDNSCPETFENIPNFISAIESGMKQYKYLKVPIFVIQNKMDLKLENSNLSTDKDKIVKKIKHFQEKHPKVIYIELSLYDKDQFYEFILELYRKMEILEKSILANDANYEDNDIYNIKFKYPLTETVQKKPPNLSEIIDCILLGDANVGKTSFIYCLLEKDITNMLSTLGIDKHMFISQVNEKTVFIRINDTAGQEKFSKALPQNYYKKADNILLFYDVMNKESFNNITYWIQTIKNTKGDNGNYELFLIGNKIDGNEKRVIEKKTAEKLAETYKIKYFECSCLNKINVYEILNEITLMAYKKGINKTNESFHLDNGKSGNKKCCGK